MEARASRPYMPDYGIKPATDGLLEWSWAVKRLATSHDYWVVTTWPDGRPHLTPVWGAWIDNALWFSCGGNSRKARNLDHDPRCSIATDNAYEPVIIDAVAERIEEFARYTEVSNAKYDVDYSVEFFAANALFAARPQSAFALDEADFTGTPTKWVF